MSDATAADAKPESPKSFLDKMGASLPIALTALATVFASMSNGALQEAMYWKSQAAQDQSRATNQWTLAGFKRDRALVMQAAAAQLSALCGYATASFDAPGSSPPDAEKRAREWLTSRDSPPAVKLPELDGEVKSLREAVRTREPEQEILKK